MKVLEGKFMKEKSIVLKCILFLLVCGTIAFGILKTNEKEEVMTDAKRFKESYESLNNIKRESDGEFYNNVSIPLDNPFKYVDIKEATDIIKNKSGILYIGANWCPWCRNAVEVLIDSAKEKNLNTIYYLDLTEYRNVFEIQNGKLVKTTTEKEGYYDLLEALDSILGEKTYTLKDKDGKIYDTKEKRIYMPTVIAIKEGNILKHHVGTVDLEETQSKYSKLTETQTKKLKTIYEEMIDSISSSVCSSNEYCD